jgi:hypothetical protein
LVPTVSLLTVLIALVPIVLLKTAHRTPNWVVSPLTVRIMSALLA